MVQKRARDDTTFNSKQSTNGYLNHLDEINGNSPSILVNHYHNDLVNSHLNKNNSKLFTKTSLLNGIRNKNKRSPTPTFSLRSPSRKTPPRRKSATPPPPVQSASVVTNGNNKNDESDAECSTSEDEDFGDIGELNDIEISDDEQSIQPSESIGTISECVGTPVFTDCVQGKYITSAPLSPSLFPNCPPYITFASHTDKGPSLPENVQKVLKWKSTTITPIVVRKVLLNSGFKLLKKTNDWIGIWGKHMKSPCFKTIRSYQKINHIPGTFQIGRKDRVWRNLQVQMLKHGKKEFNFMPR